VHFSTCAKWRVSPSTTMRETDYLGALTLTLLDIRVTSPPRKKSLVKESLFLSTLGLFVPLASYFWVW
jgi:hypothetical protein